jgi:phenylalanyl-tRNA synthetase beta chain
VEKPELKTIVLTYKNIIEILGPIRDKVSDSSCNLSPIQITNYLNRLNFTTSFNDDNLTWVVKIPISRSDDITREIDLIEEIGRLHGFNNFVTSLPTITRTGKEDFSYQVRNKLTTCFLNDGFNELIQYSLGNEKTLQKINLVNPLSTDYISLRTSLLPKLIQSVSENLKQSNQILEGFEYGHVFLGDINSQYHEKEVVAGIFGGSNYKRKWNETSTSLSWFEGKGKIENLLNKLNISVSWKKSQLGLYENLLHPYRTAELILENSSNLGIFGQIHPVIARKNNLPAELFLFEFNFENLKTECEKQKLSRYQPYSLYPTITKDLSFIVDRTINFSEIKTTIQKCDTKYLKAIHLLDEYQGLSIPKNQTSLCIQLIFQSIEKTLVTKEIEDIIVEIYKSLEHEYDISIRV